MGGGIQGETIHYKHELCDKNHHEKEDSSNEGRKKEKERKAKKGGSSIIDPSHLVPIMYVLCIVYGGKSSSRLARDDITSRSIWQIV